MSKIKIPLNGNWKLWYYNEGEGECKSVEKPGFYDEDWIKAKVPGDIHLALLDAGKIPDPYYGMNFRECYWAENVDWWYRREIEVSDNLKGIKNILVFYGLDTFATIYLNGREIGKTNNMFIKHSFDVTQKLNYGGSNLIVVKLSSPIKAVEGRNLDGLKGAYHTPEKLYARKMQMSYGWDNVPRLLTCGIWKDVELLSYDRLSIENVHIVTKLGNGEAATVNLKVEINNYTDFSLPADISINGECEENRFSKNLTVEIKPGGSVVETAIEVQKAKKWWPWTMGESNLYAMKIKVETVGELLDGYETRFGIREIKVQEEPQGDDTTSFIFSVNGKKLFINGTNWQPPDAIPALTTDCKYRELIKMVKEANLNMIRIWGGGMIEPDIFYDLCDEMGILVWQDFLFACALYPQTEDFLNEVEIEARGIVRELRNHPCLAIWSGDNEIDYCYHWEKSLEERQELNKISHQLLAKVAKEKDETRYYLPTSPHGKDSPRSHKDGDSHNWAMWHSGTSYKVMAEDNCRFISEFGRQGVPCLDTLKRFIPEDKLWPPDNEVWAYHSGSLDGFDNKAKEKLASCIMEFGEPHNLEEYISLTQLAQAESFKFAIEHFRRRKYDCGGCISWKFVDTWPSICCSLVDYYLNPKMVYYYVKKASSPILISFKEEKDGVSLWLINDTYESVKGNLLFAHRRFDGEILVTQEEEIEVHADASVMIKDIPYSSLVIQNKRSEYLEARLEIEDKEVSQSRIFFVDHKDLDIPETELDVKIVWNKNKRKTVRIRTANYARIVEIKSMSKNARFEDNYFDLSSNEVKEIKITDESGLIIKARNSPVTPL